MSGCKNSYLDELNQNAAASDIATKSKDLRYIRTLECQYMCMQRELMQLTSRSANLQFRLRQIMEASPDEQENLLQDLEALLFSQLLEYECYKITDKDTEMLSMRDDHDIFGDLEYKMDSILADLRDRFTPLDLLAIEFDGDSEYTIGQTLDNYENTGELLEADSSALRCGLLQCGGKNKNKKSKEQQQQQRENDEQSVRNDDSDEE